MFSLEIRRPTWYGARETFRFSVQEKPACSARGRNQWDAENAREHDRLIDWALAYADDTSLRRCIQWARPHAELLCLFPPGFRVVLARTASRLSMACRILTLICLLLRHHPGNPCRIQCMDRVAALSPRQAEALLRLASNDNVAYKSTSSHTASSPEAARGELHSMQKRLLCPFS